MIRAGKVSPRLEFGASFVPECGAGSGPFFGALGIGTPRAHENAAGASSFGTSVVDCAEEEATVGEIVVRPLQLLSMLIVSACMLIAPRSAQAADTQVLWLGQSAMKITSPGGRTILIDPYITQNPKTPVEWKDLDRLGHLDLILVTHAHQDHVGDAPALATKGRVPLYAPAGLSDTFVSLGLVPADVAVRMNKGGTANPLGPEIGVTMVHAEHSSELTITDPQTGKRQVYVGGEPVGFVIRLENGFTIYHMGDTALFGDMKLIAELYHPDLVMIPIGGYYVMDPTAAAYAVREYLKPKYVIPMHYGTTPLLKGTPEDFKAALGTTGTEMLVMQPGEMRVFH